MKNLNRILIMIAAVILAWIIGYAVGRNHLPETTKMVRVDTLVVRDTITEYYPVEVVKEQREIIKVAVSDTVRIHDTLYLNLPTEKKIYKGEDYYAEVSGYKPSLDRIDVFPKTTTITTKETITIEPSPWRYGVSAGVDYGLIWQRYLSPNIGAEIEYRRMALGIECGLNIGLTDKEFQRPMPYMQASIKYRLAGR